MMHPILQKIQFHRVTATWFGKSFEQPSPPQVLGWPSIAAGKHTLILAPTGSGKTLAAFLWCIDSLFRSSLAADPDLFSRNPEGVHTLYISPLKALNNDIHYNLQIPLKGIRREAEEYGIKAPEIRAAVRTGDTPPHLRQSMLKKPPHILITTPESVYLLLTSERGRELFPQVKYIIVDEIHSLAGNKRGVHLSLSLERLMALTKDEPVRIGLSATQKPLERIAAFLGGQKYDGSRQRFQKREVAILDCGQRKDMDVRVISPVDDFSDVPEATVWPAVVEKIYSLVLQHKSTLVFVNMRAQAEKLARQLHELHQPKTVGKGKEFALVHHSSISP